MNTTPEIIPSKRGCLFYLKRGLIGLLICIIGLPTVGVAYEAVMAAGDADRYPTPGRLIDVDGHLMHLNCMGEGSPTVILESGFNSTSLDWSLVQPEIAKTARVCAYDRAGLGWSEPGPEPRSPERIATELHTLLENAGESAPYVLVGHSLGGKDVRMFASLYPDEVVGMVLDDARHESLEPPPLSAEENAKANVAYRNSLGMYITLRQIGVARALGAVLLPMLSPGAENLPPETRTLISLFSSRQQTIDTMVAESADSLMNDAQLKASTLGDMPLLVLVAGTSIEASEPWLAAQQAQAALSTNGRLQIVDGAAHLIQWTHPQAVIDGVNAVIEAVRSGEPLVSQ